MAKNKENGLKWLMAIQIILLIVLVFQTAQLNKKMSTTNTDIVDIKDLDNAPNPALGPEDAEFTIIAYSDFECPYCGLAAGARPDIEANFKAEDPNWEPAIPNLIALAKEGKIRFEMRDFPLAMHANAQKAHEAAECANDQGMYWEYHEKLFENQKSLNVANMKQWAVQIGLDADTFNECLDSGVKAEEVQADVTEGQNAGVRGTPAFTINGQLVSGAVPFSAFEQTINR